MADALISPAVGGAFWTASAVTAGISARQLQRSRTEYNIPLMGVMAAFIFAAQMINFALPGTGSSGHIGGGVLLAVFLGSRGSFLTLASVLAVQALLFADGGLLALGCNIFNLAFWPAFVAYPLLYRPLTRSRQSIPSALEAVPAATPIGRWRVIGASLLAVVVALQLGSLGVVFETYLSGISALPVKTFLLFMQPVHLLIGIVEGLITAMIVLFIYRAEPGLLSRGWFQGASDANGAEPARKETWPLPVFALGTVLVLLFLTPFVSTQPDGLEWSIGRILAGNQLIAPDTLLHRISGSVGAIVAIWPEYNFFAGLTGREQSVPIGLRLAGGLLILLLAVVVGTILKKYYQRKIGS